MDVFVKSSEKNLIVFGPFDEKETKEFLFSVSKFSDSIILSGNNNERCNVFKTYSCMSGSEDQESNTGHIICGNPYRVTSGETTNYSDTCVIVADDAEDKEIHTGHIMCRNRCKVTSRETTNYSNTCVIVADDAKDKESNTGHIMCGNRYKVTSGESTNYSDTCVIVADDAEDKESNTGHIMCGNRYKVTRSETANYSDTCVIVADDGKQIPIICSSTVLNALAASWSTENSSVEIVSIGKNNDKYVGIVDVTEKIAIDGGEIANETETVNKVSITCSERNDGLTIFTEKSDELVITCNEKTEHPSNEFSKDMCPSSIIKSENIVMNTRTNRLLKIIYDIEKFFDAIDSTNKDMQKKSCILLQKQNLVDEIISYINAVQCIIRLLTSRNLLTRIIPKDSDTVYSNKPFYKAAKPFYEAGEQILDELKLYRTELQEDFKVWETYRKEILEISDQMPYDFEYCEDEMYAKVLMHEISTKVCKILKRMEVVTSKREDKNENCIDLMDSVDTYIKYSSAFIIGDRTLSYF